MKVLNHVRTSKVEADTAAATGTRLVGVGLRGRTLESGPLSHYLTRQYISGHCVFLYEGFQGILVGHSDTLLGPCPHPQLS